MGKTQSAGNRGEAAVARYLRQKGYTLLASQWRWFHRPATGICGQPQAAASPQRGGAVSGVRRAGRAGSF